MATQYEVEHNVKAEAPRARRHIDMSSFTSQLHQLTPDASDPSAQHNNPHAVPTPLDIVGLVRLVQDQFTTLARDSPDNNLLQTLFEALEADALDPPRAIAGVSQQFLDTLERVPKRSLAPDASCPICAEKFLDDAYPLVVELPCHHSHRFDMDCVAPWLQLKGTCPICRADLTEKDPRGKNGVSKRIEKMWEKEGKPVEEEEEEEDPDMLYG